MQQTLIFAVDDEEDIRELYSVALENAGFCCNTFEGGDRLFAALASARPALILLDIMLDGQDGFAILQKLKGDARYSSIPVIMVSAKGEEISKVKGLNMGADDYISKPFGVLELVARINANLRKGAPRTTLAYKDIVLDENSHEIKVCGRALGLTLKEYELLKLLLLHAADVVPREKILNSVWGEDFMGESRTLDIHIASLRKAIAGSTANINTVRGVGYSLK